ncbi:hypothetical protein GUJ93_ZPchr0010g10789 [Zizania palustris]|uniref:Uncharacterized protein n=1 Tax=Zizania palustris TaxID=103762 RepID=A0A8J6BMR9_ZIZPA|nr:hypothetical protein GUJ93_ZPchr0010g10789 [Zizania palustris]
MSPTILYNLQQINGSRQHSRGIPNNDKARREIYQSLGDGALGSGSPAAWSGGASSRSTIPEGGIYGLWWRRLSRMATVSADKGGAIATCDFTAPAADPALAFA